MHVLFLPSWYPETAGDIGGSFFREQALSLKRAGCRVGVIAPRLLSLRKPFRAFSASGRIIGEMDAGVATFRQSVPNWTPRLSPLVAANIQRTGGRLFDTYVQENGRPDIVHVHAANPAGAVARAIRERFRIPYVLSEHSSAFARNALSRAAVEAARKTAVGADARFAVSTSFARLLETRLGMGKQSWGVMPNAVDRSFLEGPIAPPKGDARSFLHISLLDENKAVDLIIRAFANLYLGRDRIRLTIGGDGPTRTRLIALAHELGVGGQVCFPGRLSRDEVRAELASCTAFVLTSRVETFGVVAIEALAMGRPVIATRCGGPEDILNMANGFLIPVDDRNALERAMQCVLTAPHQFRPQALRDDCAERFGPDTLSKRWCEIYGLVLAGECGQAP